jgi:hypothetical protein
MAVVKRREEKMVCPEGLEPPTCCLEGNCSIQLSYGQMNMRIRENSESENPKKKSPTSGLF